MDSEPLSTGLLLAQSIGFLVSLAVVALYSFLETSVTALRLFKLKEMASTTPRFKQLFKTLEENPHQILVTILIATSLANVSAAALITNITDTLFNYLGLSGTISFTLGVGIGTAFILIFGEVIPKNIAKVHGEKLFRSTLWVTNVTFYLLWPFVRLLIRFSNYFVGFIGGSEKPTEAVTSEREIRFLIDYINEKGLMDKDKTEMLQGIFELGSKQVKEIMVPTTDVIMLKLSEPLSNAINLFSKYQFSRLPVYEKTKDNIIGMIHQKDVFVALVHKEDKSIKQLLRPILFVPETMRINQLLQEFRQQGMHIAVVLNEFGSITGLVTLEDVLEEIVGEISDEYEEAPEKIIGLDKESWLVNASIDLETLGELLDIDFNTEDVVSLGGFLTAKLQHVPRKGEQLFFKDYYFYVQKASHKRVFQVLIFKDIKTAQKYMNLPKKK